MNDKINSIIHQVSQKYPHNVAIQDEAKVITYKELDILSDIFAKQLISLGVLPGYFIPIIAEKSISVLIALLGILKAGAAYVPIAADLPQETIHKILDQIGATVLCIEDDLLVYYNGVSTRQYIVLSTVWNNTLELNDPVIFPTKSESPYAYMVFTSGSTGEPKGVLITHHNLIATYRSWETVYQLSSSDRHLQMANISFDVFAGDWLRALCSGATLILCSKNILLSPAKLYELIESQKVTVTEFVPAILRLLMKYCVRKQIRLTTFRLLLCGSDTWMMSEYRQIKALCGLSTRIISSYGLTETTIDSTYFEEKNGPLLNDEDLVPLGIPFPHVVTRIVDEYFETVPLGESGELLIGGQGVAQGYFNNDVLQQERFVIDLDHHQYKMFRTGDYAKQLSDGNIYFHGRNMHCINLRGVRIDLNAVESMLKGYPKIEQALLLTRNLDNDEVELDMYLVVQDETLTYHELKNHITNKIKNFNFPKQIYIVEKLMLTFNNKINRKYVPTDIKKVLTDADV